MIIDTRWHIEAKLLHKMKENCGAISYKMDEWIVRKFQVDGTHPAYNYFFHAYGDHSGTRIIDTGPAIHSYSDFCRCKVNVNGLLNIKCYNTRTN